MARPKRDNNAAEPEMKRIAIEFSQFRTENNLSQKLLAEVIGISRRTIQSIEAARIIPQKKTLEAFKKLKDKYVAEQEA
jgi:DNA-binding XRE family transcriptional regulator